MKKSETENKRLKQEREEMKRENEKIKEEKERIEREKELKYTREIERLKKHTEEEKQNEEREKTRKEEEYKRDMKDVREMRDEMRRERDSFKSEMDELKKENKDLLIKYNKQTDKLMNTIENHERERKKREEEIIQREERYKREIEEKERKMLEDMKREREEWKKQREEEKVRREEDEKEKQIHVEQCERLKREMDEMMREKERIEREKQHQLEEFEKRVQEEKNMREEQEKNFEEQLKHVKEESEDQLKRRRTEIREEYEEICPQLHDAVQRQQTDVRSGRQHLFERLSLESDGHQNTLRASDVLQITSHSLQSHESCAEEELVKNYLQKLLMMNYRARDIKTKHINEHHHTQQTDNGYEGDIFDEMPSSNAGTSKSDSIHPMDVQIAVFHCADSHLKQMMVTKLSQCQFALPLLVPHPFTQHIEFPLWTFRQISWKLKIRKTDNDIISRVQSVCKAETPMVSFFRFGSVSSSKSQLMNSLINEKHNTFFTRNCPGSSRTRLLMDGVVEIAWYCPSEKHTDTFTDCVAFCNLHGDAGDNETQMKILTEMSSVNVVLLTKLDKNDKNASKIQELYKDKKPLICLFTDDESDVIETDMEKYKIGLKDRNQSDVSEDLRRAINDCLSSSASEFMFRLEDISKHSDIRVDEEDDEDCRRGREAAQEMMSLLKNKPLKEIKESFLPCQGKLWHQWCQKNKELHRPQWEELENDISIKLTEMMNIRQKQHKSNISEFLKLFINQMETENDNRMFFLRWLRILLNEFTSYVLSALHHKYNEKWSTVIQLKENNDKSAQLKNEQIERPKTEQTKQLKTEQTDLERISADLQAASFGLEHIMREIGQIYESCSSVKKNKTDLQFDFSSLPSFAAEMMISGFPLELMDGDAAHVPVMWVTAVLDKLIQKLGDQRVFVLSILGIQSSGKSTMLNAMFGLEFAVSAGRTTRGAFMQLIRVSEEMKHQMKFDYILVVDTEGLRALELSGKSTRHHDNELATFVVGLGHLTLINIFGENPSEMQEILQIVVQAFLRMKKVKLNPSCMFVHQNVSDVTAGEKNMEGRRRLLETLDEMTKLAAKDEVCDAECFSDVINFDVCHDVKYFAQLWEGSPPMAPPNPNYCDNIQGLKKTIISQASKSAGIILTNLRKRIHDLWEALLNERFVFSFRNSLEISAYRRLKTEYSKWTWTLRSAMIKIENKLYNQIENEEIHVIEERDLQRELKQKSDEVNKSMSEFFEKDTDADKDIMIQWKTSFEIKIKELQENALRKTRRKLNEILQQRDLKREIDAQRTHHENTLLEKSKELALRHKDKRHDEETLKREFDVFWEECVKKITRDSPPIKDIDILRDVRELLSDIHESVHVDQWKNIIDIFTVQSYSDYIQFKRFSGNPAVFRNVFRAAQEKYGLILLKEDEDQIKILISDVCQQTDEIIQSFNISKLGYNISCFQELTDYIKARIVQYEERQVKYAFKREFFIDLVFSIFKRENQTFTEQHKKFRDANNPDLYLEKKKREYYSVFQKYCEGATSAAIFGEIICQKLKEPIEQSVYRQTARDLADEMRSNCPSLNGNRSNLEQHILKRLAEEENFDKYINYIKNPRDHFKSFIRDEVSQYIRDQFSVQLRMNQNIELLQKKIMTAAHESTQHVQENRGNVDVWLKFFTLKLSDVLMFSVKDFSGVKHDDIDDFNLLEDVIRKYLPPVISDISREFSTDSFNKKLDLNYRTDEIVIDHLCQCCWVQCPFCNATCTNTIENHDGDHSVTLHRVFGINGTHYSGSTNLCISVCTSQVVTNFWFCPHDSTDQRFMWREYRRAGGVYANWSITPDFSELPYWKWFVCRFQKDLERYYNKTFQGEGEIPDKWREITKQKVIKSLDKYML
ncbi:interferon-induced very large GTPase 1-like [Triplophysa dalaica]|uniref:interferon-induced very large GTPase 1-like n=1 Tax=Triplophysa dalaica TaxID=1582913 RepID=UPI0024DF9C3F|nr:interferon-induced very large GTPase 1-like [Triplophysa dalaica]